MAITANAFGLAGTCEGADEGMLAIDDRNVDGSAYRSAVLSERGEDNRALVGEGKKVRCRCHRCAFPATSHIARGFIQNE
jgi:hypothetical protein